MRIVVAPDKFAGTLTAVEAADAIVEGWQAHAPGAEIVRIPMADGGPGFVAVLHAALGGTLAGATVRGPDGRDVPASMLLHEGTAYLESAQACGIDLLSEPDPWAASTFGVGQLLEAALDADVRKIVIGLGGSGTNDGGAGFLGALGATADVPLDAGPRGLEGVTKVDLDPVRRRLEGREVVLASDVTTPLLGLFGATKMFGPQKGLDDDEILAVDGLLSAFAQAAIGSTPADRRATDAPGAGAAGGLGFALLSIGAAFASGIDLIAEATGLAAHAQKADLVVTGEGRFDYSSRAGKVAYGVAQLAGAAARPCIVLAGEVEMGSREMRALGVESAYGMTDRVDRRTAMERPYESLRALAERVARTWSW